MKAQKLITVFLDLGIENELKLRDWFNKQFVPELRINEKVKDVRLEFITEGLLYGKVIGKKAYKVQVPRVLYNSILNSSIVTDRVIVNGKEYKVDWPEFYFANPDKITVKIKELRRKQRKGWKGKSFKSIFWDWDGAVTLRVIVETEDGKVGYYDLLRIVFVYRGNVSENLEEGGINIAKIRKEKKRIKRYLLAVYPLVADVLKRLLNAVDTGKHEELAGLLLELKELLKKGFGDRWRSAYRYILSMVSKYIQLTVDQTLYSKLMNRTAGARFLVIGEYKRVYNLVGDEIKPLKFYMEVKAKHVEREERWVDEFGNQMLMLLNVKKYGIINANVITIIYSMYGIEVDKIIAEDIEAKKRFTPAGLRGFLNHELRLKGIPPKNVTVNTVEQADVQYLKRSIRLPHASALVTAMIGSRIHVRKITREECERMCGYSIRCILLECRDSITEEKFIVYVVKPIERAIRVIIYSKDHRDEGKDRILVHLDTNNVLMFIHKL